MSNTAAQSAKNAITIAADSAKKLRACDAWRVYDAALAMGVVSIVKDMLRNDNPAAFDAMCEYEAEEIMSAIA